MSLDFFDKCKAAGIGDGTGHEGYPVVNGRIIRKVDGGLKAYFREPLKAWESPREDKDLPQATLDKIQLIEDGNIASLSQAEQDAIAAAEAEEAEKAALPDLDAMRAKIKELEALVTK